LSPNTEKVLGRLLWVVFAAEIFLASAKKFHFSIGCMIFLFLTNTFEAKPPFCLPLFFKENLFRFWQYLG